MYGANVCMCVLVYALIFLWENLKSVSLFLNSNQSFMPSPFLSINSINRTLSTNTPMCTDQAPSSTVSAVTPSMAMQSQSSCSTGVNSGLCSHKAHDDSLEGDGLWCQLAVSGKCSRHCASAQMGKEHPFFPISMPHLFFQGRANLYSQHISSIASVVAWTHMCVCGQGHLFRRFQVQPCHWKWGLNKMMSLWNFEEPELKVKDCMGIN